MDDHRVQSEETLLEENLYSPSVGGQELQRHRAAPLQNNSQTCYDLLKTSKSEMVIIMYFISLNVDEISGRIFKATALSNDCKSHL